MKDAMSNTGVREGVFCDDGGTRAEAWVSEDLQKNKKLSAPKELAGLTVPLRSFHQRRSSDQILSGWSGLLPSSHKQEYLPFGWGVRATHDETELVSSEVDHRADVRDRASLTASSLRSLKQ